MITKKLIFRGLIAVLTCALSHAILASIFGLWASESTSLERHTGNNFLLNVYYTLWIIMLYGSWILYLPGFALFYVVINRLKSEFWLYYASLGMLTGTIVISPAVLLNPITGKTFVNVAIASIIGIVYSMLYKYWLRY